MLYTRIPYGATTTSVGEPVVIYDGQAIGNAVSPNYGNLPLSTAAVAAKRGSTAAPVADAGSVIVAELRSSKLNVPGHANAAIAGLASKHTNSDHSVVQGGFFESVDYAGWDGAVGNNNFVEGVRAHGVVAADGGSGYGSVMLAGANAGVDWKYLVGSESEVINYTADATDFFDKDHFSASFLATSRGAKKVDAAYVVNPYCEPQSRFRNGFLVAGPSVEGAAFAHKGASAVGLSLDKAEISWAAITLPNAKPILGAHASGGTFQVIGYVDSTNVTVVGGDNGLKVNTGGGIGTKPVTQGGPDSGGPGYRALRVPNN